jgi:hypothetical protein
LCLIALEIILVTNSFVCDSKTGADETFKPVTYKALNEQQQVIYWVEGFPPYSYENCAIRNDANWNCKVKSAFGDYEVQMVDGKYADARVEMSEAEIVPKWKYWLTKVQE